MKKIFFSKLFIVGLFSFTAKATDLSDEYKNFDNQTNLRKAVAFVDNLNVSFKKKLEDGLVEDAKALSERIKKIILFGAEVGGIADPKILGSKAYATAEEKEKLSKNLISVVVFDKLSGFNLIEYKQKNSSSVNYNFFEKCALSILQYSETVYYGNKLSSKLQSDKLSEVTGEGFKIAKQIFSEKNFEGIKGKRFNFLSDEEKILVTIYNKTDQIDSYSFQIENIQLLNSINKKEQFDDHIGNFMKVLETEEDNEGQVSSKDDDEDDEDELIKLLLEKSKN